MRSTFSVPFSRSRSKGGMGGYPSSARILACWRVCSGPLQWPESRRRGQPRVLLTEYPRKESAQRVYRRRAVLVILRVGGLARAGVVVDLSRPGRRGKDGRRLGSLFGPLGGSGRSSPPGGVCFSFSSPWFCVIQHTPSEEPNAMLLDVLFRASRASLHVPVRQDSAP